jgi:hypothetical protein
MATIDLPGGEATHIAALPWRLDGVRVVVLAHVGDSLASRHSVENSKAGEGCAGTSTPTVTSQLNPFTLGSSPRLLEHLSRLGAVTGQPEVRPAQPPSLPRDRWWFLAEQVDGERGRRSIG